MIIEHPFYADAREQGFGSGSSPEKIMDPDPVFSERLDAVQVKTRSESLNNGRRKSEIPFKTKELFRIIQIFLCQNTLVPKEICCIDLFLFSIGKTL